MLRCTEFTSDSPVEVRSHREIEIAMRLEQQLQAQLLRPIRVHICETELQLFGQVCSWHEKQLAQEMARDVAPTYRIRNELRIAADQGRRNRR